MTPFLTSPVNQQVISDTSRTSRDKNKNRFINQYVISTSENTTQYRVVPEERFDREVFNEVIIES